MKPKKDIEASIVILNWNLPKITIDCVNSVLKQKGNYEIVLIDNGSVDNSFDLFKKEFGKNHIVRLLRTNPNLGFAGGANFGVQHAKGKFVVFLNNDSTVDKNWLKELLKPLKGDKQGMIGAVNASEIREGKSITLEKHREYAFPFNVLQYGVKVKRKAPLENLEVIPVTAIRGCSFAYRRGIVDPPFDVNYFAYAEDTKLSWVLRIQGYTIVLATGARVHHSLGASKKSNPTWAKKAIYLGERNQIMNILTFYELKTTLLIIPLLFTQIVGVNILQPKNLIYRLKAYAWLLSHPGTIMKKRKEIMEKKKLSDKELLKDMTWRLFPIAAKEFK